MRRRVVVTGMGAVTPIGNTVDDFWAQIKAGVVGIGKISRFDTAGFKATLGAEVKNFVAADRMDGKIAKRTELFAQYAVAAATEAMADAGIQMEKEDPFRVGTAVGSGVGSLQIVEHATAIIAEKGARRLKPLMIPEMTPNMAAGNVAICFGARGKSICISTACATGTHNIGEAYRSIQCGDADVMIAGGTESSITPSCVGGFSALTALTTVKTPLRASIPFDREREGFVIGEGAGIVVLEERDHALRRDAKIYGELVGYGSTADAYHLTALPPDGSGAVKAMALALEESGIKPEEIDYINAHGTSTYQNDLIETRAIERIFGTHAKTVPINSTKSMTGHPLGAAGGIEFIVCMKSMEDGFIHQTMGTGETDEACHLNYSLGAPLHKELHTVLSNSFGFGGHNAVLVARSDTDAQ